MKKVIWAVVLTIVFSLSMLSTVFATDYTDPDCVHRLSHSKIVLHK